MLKAQPAPFVVAGAIGLSLQLGRLVDGELEVYMGESDVAGALQAVATTGMYLQRDPPKPRARIVHGDNRVVVRWGLPDPLAGEIDDAWFLHAARSYFLGLRVKVAPIEELLWLRIALPSGASLGDPLVTQLLLQRGRVLDWGRLLTRLGGLEALLLSHIFLFWHQYPESARAAVPSWVLETLLRRVSGEGDPSLEPTLEEGDLT